MYLLIITSGFFTKNVKLVAFTVTIFANLYIFYFIVYIHPSDSQKSIIDDILRTSNYPDLLPKIQNIFVQLKLFILIP